jgi:hypothetical protein
MGNKLYEMIHDLELKVARIEPSQYLLMLSPEEAAAELRMHIEHLNEKFQRHEQAFIRDELDTKEALEGMRSLILDIELAKHCIACFLNRGDFTPWDSKMGSKLRSAA